MLRRDEVVSSRPGILHRRLQHALRADGERQLNCRTGIGIPNLILGRNPAVPDIANDDSRLVNGDSRPEKPAVGLGDEAEQELALVTIAMESSDVSAYGIKPASTELIAQAAQSED